MTVLLSETLDGIRITGVLLELERCLAADTRGQCCTEHAGNDSGRVCDEGVKCAAEELQTD